MRPRQRLIGGAVVSAAVLVVLVTAHPAVPVSMLAASSIAGGSNIASDGTSTGTWDGTTRNSCCTDSISFPPSNSVPPTSVPPTSVPPTSVPPTSVPGGTPPGGPSTGGGIPIALMSGGGGGAVLLLLLLLWALLSHRAKLRRDVPWVKQHLRAVAQASPDPPSAEIRRRPGARSVSLGLEPHDDHLGYQEN